MTSLCTYFVQLDSIAAPLILCAHIYFVHKRSATHKLKLSCLHKVTAAFRMLCNGVVADTIDEYVCVGKSTAIESMRMLVIAVVEIFEAEYLRSPNENDIARLLDILEERGFPAC
jgi:hypothetical protein